MASVPSNPSTLLPLGEDILYNVELHVCNLRREALYQNLNTKSNKREDISSQTGKNNGV